MRGVLSDEELRATDYAPLVSTFDVRMFGLKLAIANDVDVVAGFREFGFLRDGDAPMGAERESKENEGGGDCKDAPQEAGGKVSEAELKAKTRPAQITCFAECLKAARRALPIADFALISTRDALVDRIPTVGESVETACDLKEARREFIGHSERLRELVKATKRAAEDIKSRKCAKASKVTREIQKQQHEMSKQAKAASSQAAKAQKRAAQEEVNRQKKLQEQAAAELSGQAGAPEWTIMDVDLQHHAALPEYAADNFPGSDVNFDAPYLVKDVKLQAVLKKHESVINIWLAGFDRSEVVLSKGRSSWPLQDAPEVRGKLLKYGPPIAHRCHARQSGIQRDLEQGVVVRVRCDDAQLERRGTKYGLVALADGGQPPCHNRQCRRCGGLLAKGGQACCRQAYCERCVCHAQIRRCRVRDCIEGAWCETALRRCRPTRRVVPTCRVVGLRGADERAAKLRHPHVHLAQSQTNVADRRLLQRNDGGEDRLLGARPPAGEDESVPSPPRSVRIHDKHV